MTDIIQQPKANIVLDASKYDTFRSCEAKFNFRYNMNKVSPDKAKPLERGTLVHLAAETYYEMLRNGHKYDDCVVKALSAVRVAGVSSDLEVDEVIRVIDVMEEYFDHWRVDDQKFQIVEVEKPFMYLLHEAEHYRIYMTGKIDLLFTDNRYTNCPMDHKSFDRSYPTGRMSNQFKNYAVATESNYLFVNKIGFQKTLKPEEKYLRIPLSFDPLYLSQWKDNVISVMAHYADCAAEGYWPMNETSCDKFNRKCEYFSICDSSGQPAKQFKIQTDLVDGEVWDVTKTMKRTSEVVVQIIDEGKDVES